MGRFAHSSINQLGSGPSAMFHTLSGRRVGLGPTQYDQLPPGSRRSGTAGLRFTGSGTALWAGSHVVICLPGAERMVSPRQGLLPY